MFRHHNNHIVIYRIGKVIRLLSIDIFKLNHNLRLTNHRILLHYKLFPIIKLTSNHNLHSFVNVSQEVQTMRCNQTVHSIKREPHQRGLAHLQHSYLRYIVFCGPMSTKYAFSNLIVQLLLC